MERMNKEEMMSKIAKMECEINYLKKELNKQEESKKGRWKPELHDEYYCIDSTGAICVVSWEDWETDKIRYALCNCFKTTEEAEFAVEQLKVSAELKEYADDIEWNGKNKHWCIESDANDRHIYVDTYNYIIKVPFNIYFSSQKQAEKAIDAIGEERLKKYYFCVVEE